MENNWNLTPITSITQFLQRQKLGRTAHQQAKNNDQGKTVHRRSSAVSGQA